MKRAPRSETYINGHATASKALTTLKGLIDGVTCDHEINDMERAKILAWIDHFSFLKGHPVIGSVFDYLAEALADGKLTLEECKDISWMIDRNLKSFYNETTQAIQHLHGLIGGIAADQVIAPIELKYLWDWIDANEGLKGAFPYDEIYSLLCQIGEKQTLSVDEKKLLLEVFDWAQGSSVSVKCPFIPWTVAPFIEFKDRSFCLTGVSKKKSRKEIISIIQEKKGTVLSSVSKKLDYLVIFDDANVAWTHACYGRKVEYAIKLRREGTKLALITEKDFWDSLAE